MTFCIKWDKEEKFLEPHFLFLQHFEPQHTRDHVIYWKSERSFFWGFTSCQIQDSQYHSIPSPCSWKVTWKQKKALWEWVDELWDVESLVNDVNLQQVGAAAYAWKGTSSTLVSGCEWYIECTFHMVRAFWSSKPLFSRFNYWFVTRVSRIS